MATKLPRVNVTLTIEQFALLSRLAEYQGRSRSAILGELLETVMPVFERVVVMAEAAGRAERQAFEGFRSSMERAQREIEPMLGEALAQYDWVTGIGPRLRASSELLESSQADGAAAVGGGALPVPDPIAGKKPSPRPVTRGPGMGARPRQKRVRTPPPKRRKGARS